jgi:hypothetical protein
MVQDRGWWGAVVNTVMNLEFYIRRGIPWLAECRLLSASLEFFSVGLLTLVAYLRIITSVKCNSTPVLLTGSSNSVRHSASFPLLITLSSDNQRSYTPHPHPPTPRIREPLLTCRTTECSWFFRSLPPSCHNLSNLLQSSYFIL